MTMPGSRPCDPITPRERWAMRGLVVGCTAIVACLVWTMTASGPPAIGTIATSFIAGRYYLRERQGLASILLRTLLIGSLMVGAWWCMNHLHR